MGLKVTFEVVGWGVFGSENVPELLLLVVGEFTIALVFDI